MSSVLFVCTANQCRSPMAMAIMRDALQKMNLAGNWRVESAGTWAIDDFPATSFAIQTMQERGLALQDHRSRKTTRAMLAETDLVLTMERNHAEALKNEFPDEAHKVYGLSEMIGEHWDVIDPIGGTLENYRAAAQLLEDTISQGLERILELARLNANQARGEKAS